MAVLHIIAGPNAGQQIRFDGAKAVIGRHPSCDIVLDVGGAISRQHAQLLRDGDVCFIEDLGSRNGTYVNGQKIEGRRKLAENDEVKICEVIFRFHHGQPPPDSTWATLVEEDEATAGSSGSQVMSRIDVSSSSGLRVSVNPEAKLKALIEISKSLANSLAEEQVLSKILDSLFRVFPQADRGFIILRETPSSPLIPKAVKYRRGGQDETVRLSRTVVSRVMESKEAILSADAATDARFAMSESIADFRIRSMMCVPLINSEGQAIGILQIDTLDQRSRFQESDLDVLAIVASQAAFSIENAQLHRQALWQESIRRDLALGRQVQQGFLPKEPPQIEGYQFFNFYEPASQVGGDFYDYVRLPGSRLAVIVADVSGKGISAALLMAKVTSEARYHLATHSQPAVAINSLSKAFGSYGWSDRFVTFVMGVVDYKLHEVIVVNAGHMAPLLRRRNGDVEEIGEHVTGVPLGVDPDWEYEEFRFVLQPGEIVTAFTDGFSEAENEKRELYGMGLLQRQVRAPAANATELGQRILADIKRHVGNHRQSDDMCLLCFGRTE